jgi:hypothetical protein
MALDIDDRDVYSDQDPGYSERLRRANSRTRIIRWQVWSLRRTMSVVDARFLTSYYIPFLEQFDPALIDVFCSDT